MNRFVIDVNAISGDEGNTPLHETVRKGHYDCFKFLLESMANVNILNYR